VDSRSLNFAHPPVSWELFMPSAPEDLIDRDAFEADQRMPYWADLWPAALAMARHILEMPEPPQRAIELGCGIGLVSLALISRGVDVVATDYEDDALGYVRRNAAHNGLAAPRTAMLDWRAPSGVEPAPLVVAADVLYEARHVRALAHCFELLVAPGGRGVIADPGRSQLFAMLDEMRSRGWTVRALEERDEQATAASVLGNPKPSIVQIHELRPPTISPRAGSS